MTRVDRVPLFWQLLLSLSNAYNKSHANENYMFTKLPAIQTTGVRYSIKPPPFICSWSKFHTEVCFLAPTGLHLLTGIWVNVFSRRWHVPTVLFQSTEWSWVCAKVRSCWGREILVLGCGGKPPCPNSYQMGGIGDPSLVAGRGGVHSWKLEQPTLTPETNSSRLTIVKPCLELLPGVKAGKVIKA